MGDPVEAGVAAPVPRPDPRLEQVARPRYVPPAPEAPPWLAAFRLQVAARGPRLAACFEGAPRPGSLRWTTALEPGSGRVSDHVLAPTTQSDPLTAAQRACVIGVLETPPYRLEGTHTATTPPRVSIGIAF